VLPIGALTGHPSAHRAHRCRRQIDVQWGARECAGGIIAWHAELAFSGSRGYFSFPKLSHFAFLVHPMNENPPDRLSTDPTSPFYDAAILERGIGIRFNGVEKNNVDEYCVSEGWIRVVAGKAKDRKGNQMTIKLKGEVEPYFRQGEGQ
jgi:hypothetical protein